MRDGDIKVTENGFAAFLRRELNHKRKSIEFFEQGCGGTHEIKDGKMIDTTAESLALLREQMIELERLLASYDQEPRT